MVVADAGMAGAVEALAQGRPLVVVLPVAAAAAQLRHHQVDEVDEGPRGHCVGEVEAVDVGLVDPAFELVGDRRGRADEDRAHRPDADELRHLAGVQSRSGSALEKISSAKRAESVSTYSSGWCGSSWERSTPVTPA